MSYRPVLESLEERALLSKSSIHDHFMSESKHDHDEHDDDKPAAIQMKATLKITIDGQAIPVQAGIGLEPDGVLPIHTDDDSGVLHIETNDKDRIFRLGDFFAIWSQTPQGAQIVERIEAAESIFITFNGVSTADLDDLVLQDQETIVIRVLSNAPSSAAALNEALVVHLYHDMLQRDVGMADLVIDTTALNQGMPRSELVESLESSREYQMLEVDHLYQTLLHRHADDAGLTAFVNFLAAGGTLDGVRAQLLGSDEYFNDAGGSNEAYLTALYADVLHREIDATGDQAWGASLAAGTSRVTIAEDILQSPEGHQDLIQAYYHQLLHRNADAAGLASFMSGMQHGLREDQLVAVMAGSEEYWAANP